MLSHIIQPFQSQPAIEIKAPASTNGASENTEDSPIAYNGIQDRISLSRRGRSLSQQDNSGKNLPQSSNQNQFTPEEQQVIQQLKQRDMEVRSHEMAHLSRAGQYAAGGMQFSYQKGPDGRRYAIGGEVPIDVSKEKTPEETIRKMQTVRAAALAPANPSGADRRIAAAASMKEAQARQELQAEQTETASHNNGINIPEQNSSSQSASEVTPSEQTRRYAAPLSILA